MVAVESSMGADESSMGADESKVGIASSAWVRLTARVVKASYERTAVLKIVDLYILV